MRRVIGKRLTESFQTAPHFAVTVEIEMDRVLELRQLFNFSAEADKRAKLSVGDFITKATALALQDVPEVNAAWMGDFIRLSVLCICKSFPVLIHFSLYRYNKQHICIAVATPTGLITPIITNVGSRGLASVSAETKAMAVKARDGKLKPEEYQVRARSRAIRIAMYFLLINLIQGGTFTISNLGMFGVGHFTAILNPPQSFVSRAFVCPCQRPDLAIPVRSLQSVRPTPN